MEAYAAALAYCDDQMGRVIGALRESGQLDNTVVVYVQGDNGATPEGGELGMANYAGGFLKKDELSAMLPRIDDIGGPKSYPVAPLGWMMAMNTPFPYHKVVASRLGGITNGMVISWPRKIAERGVRRQFTHLVDVTPTILDLAGIKPPESLNGVAQQPFDGISFAYSFADAKVPEKPRTQYFEVFGNASLYRDGWLAASPVMALGRPGGAAPALAETWELYDLRSDSSQTVNVAARYPDKLRELRQVFDEEARRNYVLPMSSDSVRYLLPGTRPEVTFQPGRYTFAPSDMRYPRWNFPSIHNRSWTIEADVDTSASGEGMLVTQGGRFSGWGLALFAGVPTFLYRTGDSDDSRTRLAAPAPLSPGAHKLEVGFAVDGPGLGKGGTLTLKVDGQAVATGKLAATAPIRLSEEDASVGRDSGTGLTEDYRLPFRASGLRSVTISLEPVQKMGR
jgi:arylsulfatase